MEPRAHHVLIGLFTLLAATAAVVFSLWLAKSHQQGQVQHYDVIFNEPVRGLSRGSAVLYNGIRIGEVTALHLDPADLRMAQARIAIDANIPVRQDTQARLVLTGITGTSVIELSGGSPTSPLLMEPENGNAVIIATPSPLTQLLAGSDHLMTNISELVLSAKTILSPANVERFSNTLHNLDELMASLADQRNDLKTLMNELTSATAHAGDTLNNASELIDSAKTLVSEQGSATFEHARRTMASLETASEALATLIKDNEGAIATGVRGFGELGPALQALRQTLESIQTVTRRLDESPGRYLLGRDKVQEFEP